MPSFKINASFGLCISTIFHQHTWDLPLHWSDDRLQMGARRNHPHLGSHFSGMKCLWNRSRCNKYDYIAVKTMQWYSAIITAANTYIIRTTFEKYKPSLYKHLLTCQMDNPTQEQNKNIHTHIFVGLPPWTYVFSSRQLCAVVAMPTA